jgi:HK97 family phage portal protein
MFTGIKKLIVKFAKSLDTDGSFSSLVGGGSDTPLSGNASDSNLIGSNKNWVFVCTNKIAMTMAGITLKLRKYNTKGEDEEVFENPVLTLLAKPNKFQTGRDFWYMIVSHLELTGNAYLLKDKEMNPTELMPLIPSNVRCNLNESTKLVEYAYQNNGKGIVYPAGMIIHLKHPNPSNILKGRGTLAGIAEWVDVDAAATEFNRLFFKNGAAPSGILETQATDEQGLKLARVGFEQKYQGALNSHKTAILPKGAKYTSMTTPADMQFVEADSRFRDKILSGFGVPKSVVGIVEDVNRANADSSNYVFMKFTIDPKMRQIISYLDELLLPAFNIKGHYFDYDNIIPENEDFELRENQVALAGQSYMSINEVRAREGLPRIDNGDFIYGGFATIPIGKPEVQENSLDDATTKGNKKNFNPKFAREFAQDKMTDKIVDKVAGNIASKTKEMMEEVKHKEFITRVTPYESKFVKQVKVVDEKMKEMALASVDQEKAFGTWASRKGLLDMDKVEQLFVSFTVNVLQDLIKEEGQAQMSALEAPAPFNPMNETMQDKLKNTLKLTAQSYTTTTLKLLNSSLDEGVSNGESLAKLTERVAEVFNLTDTYRAEQVARTTVFSMANASAREAYKQSGVVNAVKWHTAEDEMTCEFCEPLNDKIIDIDDVFFEKGDVVRGSKGGKLSVAFGDVEDPPVHPNCRCFTLAEDISVERSTAPVQSKDDEADFLKNLLEVLEGKNHEAE